jgi:hypothetical protein
MFLRCAAILFAVIVAPTLGAVSTRAWRKSFRLLVRVINQRVTEFRFPSASSSSPMAA